MATVRVTTIIMVLLLTWSLLEACGPKRSSPMTSRKPEQKSKACKYNYIKYILFLIYSKFLGFNTCFMARIFGSFFTIMDTLAKVVNS